MADTTNTETDSAAAIAVGSMVLIVKGCNALGITKGATAQVKEITALGADYGYAVRVVLYFLNTFASGKTLALHARHINRLSDQAVNLSAVRPEDRITVARK